MSADDEHVAHASRWKRWTGERGPFYRSCAVLPFDAASDETAAIRRGVEKPAVEVSTGVVRLLLRNVPTLLIVVLAVYVPANVASWVRSGRLGLSIPSPGLVAVLAGVVGLLVGAVWLALLYRVVTRPLGASSVHRSLVFYATALPLAAGTAYAAFYAWNNVGSTARPALTVQAGYFLFVLVEGHLVYDLVLRAENLFATLGSTSVVDRQRYAAFYDELTETLGSTVLDDPVSVPRSLAFALVLALGPILLPVLVAPWDRFQILAYVGYSVVTLFVVAMLYDMFVLIYEFTQLLRSDVLTYQPFHPDEHGGFRDLGRFATRVNVVLVVAGGYVAYRLYGEGLLNVPADPLASPVLALTWAVLYLGPIAAYAFLMLFWLYHSFWRLHKKMQRGRKQRMEDIQRQSRRDDDPPSREFVELETDAPAWESLRTAPTWPIARQGMVGILVVDALPVLVTFLP